MEQIGNLRPLIIGEEDVFPNFGYYAYKTYKIIYQEGELLVLNRGIAIHSRISDKLRVSKSPLLIPNFYDGEKEVKSDIFELDDFLIFTTRGIIGREELSRTIRERGKLTVLNLQSISTLLNKTGSTKRLDVSNEDNKIVIRNFQNVYEVFQLNRKKLYLLLDWNTGRVIEIDNIYGFNFDRAYFGYPINSKLVPLRDFAHEHGTRELKKRIQEARQQAKNLRNPPKPSF